MAAKLLMGGAVVLAVVIAVLYVITVFGPGLGLAPEVPQIPAD
jgi:hypothetical protein